MLNRIYMVWAIYFVQGFSLMRVRDAYLNNPSMLLPKTFSIRHYPVALFFEIKLLGIYNFFECPPPTHTFLTADGSITQFAKFENLHTFHFGALPCSLPPKEHIER